MRRTSPGLWSYWLLTALVVFGLRFASAQGLNHLVCLRFCSEQAMPHVDQIGTVLEFSIELTAPPNLRSSTFAPILSTDLAAVLGIDSSRLMIGQPQLDFAGNAANWTVDALFDILPSNSERILSYSSNDSFVFSFVDGSNLDQASLLATISSELADPHSLLSNGQLTRYLAHSNGIVFISSLQAILCNSPSNATVWVIGDSCTPESSSAALSGWKIAIYALLALVGLLAAVWMLRYYWHQHRSRKLESRKLTTDTSNTDSASSHQNEPIVQDANAISFTASETQASPRSTSNAISERKEMTPEHAEAMIPVVEYFRLGSSPVLPSSAQSSHATRAVATIEHRTGSVRWKIV